MARSDRFHLPHWLRQVVMVLAVAIFLVNLGARIAMIPEHRTELGGVERNIVYGIQKVMLDTPLYSDPEELPFEVIQYPPAYYLLCATVATWCGLDPMEPYGLFVTSRVVSLLFNLLTVLLFWRAALCAGAAQWPAGLAALLLFCSYTEPAFSRVDAMQLLFFAAAIFLYVRWLKHGDQYSILLIAGCTALSYFCKQNGLLVGGLIGLHLLWERRYVPLLQFSAALILLVVVGHVWIFSVWPRDIYLKNTVQGLMNGINLIALKDMLLFWVHLFGVGWYALTAWVVLRKTTSPSGRFLRLAAPLALVVGGMSMLKAGSSLNYLYEGHALTAVACAVLLSGEHSSDRIWGRYFVGYALFFMAFRTLLTFGWVNRYGPDELHVANAAADREVYRVLTEELGSDDGSYVFLGYRDHLEHLLVGKAVLPQKDIVHLSRSEIFDRSRFHRAMEDGTVRYAVYDQPVTEVEFLGRVYPGFVPLREVEGRTILVFVDAP